MKLIRRISWLVSLHSLDSPVVVGIVRLIVCRQTGRVDSAAGLDSVDCLAGGVVGDGHDGGEGWGNIAGNVS